MHVLIRISSRKRLLFPKEIDTKSSRHHCRISKTPNGFQHCHSNYQTPGAYSEIGLSTHPKLSSLMSRHARNHPYNSSAYWVRVSLVHPILKYISPPGPVYSRPANCHSCNLSAYSICLGSVLEGQHTPPCIR
jgi:hypothetical protein